MGFYVPYVVNGAKHSARLFRRKSQQDAGEGSGIDRPGDLKVQALNTPGTGFRVASGGGIAQSRDSFSASRESYGVINDAEVTVLDVPGTGSSGARRDLVILEITDPEIESVVYPAPTDEAGWQDGNNFARITVIPGVSSSITSLDQITTGPFANVTGITLAAINWPSNTATITNALITDLRVVQNPFSERVWRTVNLAELQRLSATTAYPTGGQTWPVEFTGEAGKLKIPKRATHARVRMDWGSVRFIIATQGLLWVQVGQNTHPDVQRTKGMSFDAAATSREPLFVADTIPIPASMRGTEQWFFPRANLSAAISTESQRPYVNTSSGIVLDVEFFEDTV